jgi:pimeloyl-ACP methyl ester carboxylesterase
VCILRGPAADRTARTTQGSVFIATLGRNHGRNHSGLTSCASRPASFGALIALPFGRYRADGVGHHAGSSRPSIGYDASRAAPDFARHESYDVLGYDIGMWIAYALASEPPQVVTGLASVETVIPGLARLPFVFVHQRDNAFLRHSLFNQPSDLPEVRIKDRERAYLFWSLRGSGTWVRSLSMLMASLGCWL